MMDAEVMEVLTRIADALDRAFPKPLPVKKSHLVPGVAEYTYEDPQTLELRQIEKDRQEAASNGRPQPIR